MGEIVTIPFPAIKTNEPAPPDFLIFSIAYSNKSDSLE
jgi:hypothetical protein